MKLIQDLSLADMAAVVERACAVAEGRWLSERAGTAPLSEGGMDGDAEQGPAPLGMALAALFEVLSRIDSDLATGKRNVSDQQLTELGVQGQQLIDDLLLWYQQLQIEADDTALRDLSIALSEWLVAHGAELQQLETVVNRLAELANNSQDTDQLTELDGVMDRIIGAIDGEQQADLEDNNPQRPWRVLLLNHAIVATRTLSPERMMVVFDRLVQYLPDDAPGFFTQGMGQIDAIAYPPEVRDVMERYYLMWNTATLH